MKTLISPFIGQKKRPGLVFEHQEAGHVINLPGERQIDETEF